MSSIVGHELAPFRRLAAIGVQQWRGLLDECAGNQFAGEGTYVDRASACNGLIQISPSPQPSPRSTGARE
jgi:hypothetical protein